MKKLLSLILVLIMVCSVSSTSFAADSYTEYFSEEREFVVVDNALDSSTYLYSDKETGYLYSRNIDTKEENLIYKGNITNHYVYNGDIYGVLNGNNIIKISKNNKIAQTILMTNNVIDQFYVNDDLIFYLANNAIYRYHIESKKTDLLVQDSYIHYFYPYSNYIIEFGNGNGEVYRLNTSGKFFTETRLENYTFLEEANSNIITPRAAVNVHGKSLPLSAYLDESYFTKTGSACKKVAKGGCHGSGEVCVNNVGECSSCKDHYGAAQCMGFSHYVFKQLWEHEVSNAQTHSRSLSSILDTSEFLWDCPSGTELRVTGPQTTGHSIIIADVTTTGVYVYHANGHGGCKVYYEYMSFATFKSNYNYVEYSYDGEHTFGSGTGYDSLRHWNKCTRSGCNGKTNFESHTFTTSGNYKVCDCGYRVAITK